MDDLHPLAPDDLGGNLADDQRARIKAELLPGERLLWAARRLPRPKPSEPRPPGRQAKRAVAVFMGVIAGLSFALARGAFGPLVPDPTGPVAVGVIAPMLGLAFALDGDHRPYRPPPPPDPARTLYALTDRRAIVWTPKHDHPEAIVVYTVARGRVGHLHRVEYPDGTGDVLFSGAEDDYWGAPGFEGVAEVRRVEDLVRRTLIHPDALG